MLVSMSHLFYGGDEEEKPVRTLTNCRNTLLTDGFKLVQSVFHHPAPGCRHHQRRHNMRKNVDNSLRCLSAFC